ncbi:MAG: hypothetical protein FD155_3382 [Bacteroidetes bacterium]|nr:MAG: hypothetical protein FD155_3382 [Bacteroidota bacterium]
MNIFTQSTSPAFMKQAVDEFFIQPMFTAEDIRGIITVRTDVKGTERLNRIGRPSMMTKPKAVPGFNPAGSFNLTYTDITVKPMSMEFEQNAREFWGSIVEQLLASGYKEDDIEQMKSPDVWNKIMLPLIATAGQDDLIRQMFFANPLAEVMAGGIPNGTIDDNYSGYNGFMSWLLKDTQTGVIPAAQHIPIASSVAAVKAEKILTYTAGTDTAINVVINGVTYTQAFASNATTTVANWLTAHKAAIEARADINGVIVTVTGAGIKVVSKSKGQEFTFTATVTGTGTFAASGVVAATKAGKLDANESDSTLEAMLDAITPEMHEFNLNFMITSSMWRNLVHTFKSRETVLGDAVMQNGLKVKTYEGYPIIVRPDWDKWITSAQNGIHPHRAVLTTSKNLLFATDGTSDSEMIETWYNQEAQMRRYRVQYKAQTAYLHKELVVLAGFKD